MAKPAFIYVYDALCGWCYGFSPVIKSLYEKYSDVFDFQVLSGGMILGDRVGPVSQMADMIRKHRPIVEETTGVKFGEAFSDVLNEGTMILSSEKPSIALSVFKSYMPEKAVLYAHDLQRALNFYGKDLNNEETYRELAEKYELPIEEFIEKLEHEEYRQLAYYDVALARQLQVTGFPAAFIKTGDLSFHMVAKGFADEQTMELRIRNVMKEAGLNWPD